MKLLRRRIKKHYRAAHLAGKENLSRRPYVVPILGLFVGAALMGAIVLSRPAAGLRPSSSHVVFLSDSGNRQTLDTKAKTVGDLIKKLPNLDLLPQDVVEPSLDTPIVQDNFRINIYRSRPVTVVDESTGLRTVTLTAQLSARVVAQAAGETVYPEDNVSFAPGNISQNILGEQVVIDRATPVQLSLYGASNTVRTHSKTVADLIRDKKIELTKDDTVTPALSTPITAGMQISIVRNGVQLTNVSQTIAPPVQYVNDPSLTLGATAVRQPGTPGTETVTYQVVTQNGVITSRTVVQQVVVTPPVPEIIARGSAVYVAGDKTAIMAAAGISSSDYGYVDYIVSHESNWNPAAVNYVGCIGLGQACPTGIRSNLEAQCPDWQADPACQLRVFSGYAGKYGGWYGSYVHWVSYRSW